MYHKKMSNKELIELILDDMNTYQPQIVFYENPHNPIDKAIYITMSNDNRYIIEWENPVRNFGILHAHLSNEKKVEVNGAGENTSRNVTYYRAVIPDRHWYPFFIAIEDKSEHPIFPDWWLLVEHDLMIWSKGNETT